VTESLLQIPNLITPDSPTGTNQVFKVKYQSLTSFEMWVYNRWGQQLFHTKDPAQGWDGTQSGRPVPTGAYYYLVKAKGTDGISYTKKGDINVLRTKEVMKQ
jgi:gliding motility-associated-like protein